MMTTMQRETLLQSLWDRSAGLNYLARDQTGGFKKTQTLDFFGYYEDAKGMRIEEVVYQINDFIEALGFNGRFAAFTLCILNSMTRVVRF